MAVCSFTKPGATQVEVIRPLVMPSPGYTIVGRPPTSQHSHDRSSRRYGGPKLSSVEVPPDKQRNADSDDDDRDCREEDT